MANYSSHYYKFLDTGVSKTQVQAKEFVTYNYNLIWQVSYLLILWLYNGLISNASVVNSSWNLLWFRLL